jgi:hypothetical protein
MWLALVNHEPSFEFAHSKPPPSQFPPTSCSLAPCIFSCHSESFIDVYKMPMYAPKKYTHEIIRCNYGTNSMSYLLTYS